MQRVTWPGTTEEVARPGTPRRGAAHAVVFPTGPRGRSSRWTGIGLVLLGVMGAWVLWGAAAPRDRPRAGPGPMAWWPAADSLRADTNDTLRPVLEAPAPRPTLARNGATLLAQNGVPPTRLPTPRPVAPPATPPPRTTPARPAAPPPRPAPVRVRHTVVLRGERDQSDDEPIAPAPSPPSDPDTDRPVSRPATPVPTPGSASLAVGSLPWGQLYIDGQHAGNTPALGVAIAAGYHRVRVSRAGFAPFDTTIAVTAGSQIRLAGITLRPCTGDSC